MDELVPLHLFVLDCSECGVVYAITKEYEDRRRHDHRGFHCPNGHSQYFSRLNREEQLRKELEAEQRVSAEARSKARRERELRQHAERSASAYKGQLTKTKKRVANGVCPCCNRFFANLHLHMSNQHPDFVEAK